MRPGIDWVGVALYALCLMPFAACTVAIRFGMRWRDMQPISRVIFQLLLSVDVVITLSIVARLVSPQMWFDVLRIVLVLCVIATGWRLFAEIRRIQTGPTSGRRSTDT